MQSNGHVKPKVYIIWESSAIFRTNKRTQNENEQLAAYYIPLRLATDLDLVMNDVELVLPPGVVLDPRRNELAWANDRIPTLFSLRQENSEGLGAGGFKRVWIKRKKFKLSGSTLLVKTDLSSCYIFGT